MKHNRTIIPWSTKRLDIRQKPIMKSEPIECELYHDFQQTVRNLHPRDVRLEFTLNHANVWSISGHKLVRRYRWVEVKAITKTTDKK